MDAFLCAAKWSAWFIGLAFACLYNFSVSQYNAREY